jgi:flagellar biosynthetic protein FliQ
MTMSSVVELGRRTLEISMWLALPLLLTMMVVSLVINVVQVLTSVQEPTISTVPRLAVAAGAVFALMPWMLRQLTGFTVQLFSDFRPFVR